MILAQLSESALLANVAVARSRAQGAQILAMVKADAYGHDMLGVAERIASHVDALGVARVDEAVRLRDHGIHAPVVVVEGPASEEELRVAQQLKLTLAIHQFRQIQWLVQHSAPTAVWLKIDTSMHRLGFAANEAQEGLTQLMALDHVHVQTIMSHLACSDEPEHPMNAKQAERFDHQLAPMQALAPNATWSLGNSGYVLSHGGEPGSWVRPGIMLYGASPSNQQSAAEFGLTPVMRLVAPVLERRTVAVGETVGYGCTWTAVRPTDIAVVGIGYGDGFPRSMDESAQVYWNGYYCPIVGRVSMDKVMVDVTDLPNSIPLDEMVELWGIHRPLNDVAQSCGTIAYEVTCQLTGRVRKAWVKEHS